LTQQFTATGTYTDGSTQNLTTSVTWSSSSTSIATISNTSGSNGLATSVATGSTTITASHSGSGVGGSTTFTITPINTPAAPTGLTLTPGNSQLAATWIAPTVNGGAAITDYVIEYRTSPAGAWTTFADGTSTATNTTITGLTNGTTYDVRVSAVNSAGTGSPSPVATATPVAWTPAALGANLALWLDAADASTITLNGSTVSQWNDKSGNSRNATQSNASLQPTYNTTVVNGRPALVFTNHQLDLPAGTYTPSPAIAIAANRGTATGVGLLLQNTTQIVVPFNYTASTNFWCARRGSGQIAPTVPPASAGGSDIYLGDSGASNGTTWTYTYNGSTPATTTNFGLAGGTSNGNLIGRDAGGGSPLQGNISEIVVTNGNLSTTDRQRLEGYLAHKWGLTANLPAGHPYKTTPP